MALREKLIYGLIVISVALGNASYAAEDGDAYPVSYTPLRATVGADFSASHDPDPTPYKLNTTVLKGPEIAPFLPTVAEWIVTYFREFPYLYDGTISAPQTFLEAYTSPFARIITVTTPEGETIGFATCSPLVDSPIGCKAKETLTAGCPDIRNCYCLNEGIIAPSHRGRHLMGRVLGIFESLARELGFLRTCFFTVLRHQDDPRRPADYKDLGPVFEHFGYSMTIRFECVWPTIQPCGSTQADCVNPMVLWVKDLS